MHPFSYIVWVRFFCHRHFYKVPFFFNCFAPIFLATVIFIRRIFYPTLFGSDFFGHSHFYKVPFFSTVWLRFFGNSHFINCIVLSCTVAQFFFASHFYRVPFFCFQLSGSDFFGHCHFYKAFFFLRCLVQIFWATVIFVRCHFLQLFGSVFLATVIL